tara:strand:+ start:49762 stop:50160 length:399 start_codon:yes stop_codon:yes gene_type:complete
MKLFSIFLLFYSLTTLAQTASSNVELVCVNEKDQIGVEILRVQDGTLESRVKTKYLNMVNPIITDETVDGVRTLKRMGRNDGDEIVLFLLSIQPDGNAYLNVAVPFGEVKSDVRCNLNSVLGVTNDIQKEGF